ncbi:MAG TPA: TIGR02677 family protein [Terriglobia bacterium]|jgi:uncharacterized protein (TIGR02677 family)
MNTPQKLKVFEYVTAEKAPLYRAVMRVFMHSKERFALHLRPADVLAGFGPPPVAEPLDLPAAEALLNQLCEWGNLESHPDTADVTTVEDFLRRRYLFQITVRGEAAERAVTAYEESILQPGELQTAALADIRSLLEELARFAESAEIDDAKTTLALRTLCLSFEELTRRAQIFMSGLQRRIDLQRIEIEEFILYKERLIDYLQRFVGELVIAADEIASGLRRIESAGVDRLLTGAARREVADLLNATPEDLQSAALHWKDRWEGLRSWFIGNGNVPSHAETLRARALSAIPALLTAVANINDRRVTRIDRVNDLRTLAGWFAEAETESDAHCLWRAAFGLHASRHLMTNDETLDLLDAAGVQSATSWFEAPPMKISVRLRTTGSHTKKGRSSAIVDRSREKDLLARFAAEESAQIERARRVLAQGKRILLSEIGKLDTAEFDLFLEILGEALAMKSRPQDSVEIVSSDGALRITLEPVPNSGTAIIRAPSGDFSGPDHAITIEQLFQEQHDAGSIPDFSIA